MSLNYSTDFTGLFFHVGALIRRVNLLGNDEQDYDYDLNELADGLEESDDLRPMIEQARGIFVGLQTGVISARESLARLAEDRLTDRASVINELNLESAGLATVLERLIRQMNDDSETVKACTVTIGSVTADAGNTGNGTVLTTKVLDGVTSPAEGVAPHIEYLGLDSEFGVPSETMTLTCIADEDSDGATSGEETFSWNGEIPNESPWSTDPEGSGPGPSIPTLNAGTIIDNKNFEDFTSNAPDDWDVDSGTAGTHIDDEASEVYRGSKSLKLAGDGAQATIQISQDVGNTEIVPRRRYCFSIRYKTPAADSASQALVIQFEGTGYTAGSTEKINLAGDTWQTSWTLAHFFVNMPAQIPDDFELVIKVTGTMNTGKILYLDSIGFEAVQYHGGIGACVVAGSTPFVRGDRFNLTVANDQAGLFSDFARRQLRCQFPSVTTGAETISDVLAM